MFEISKRSLRHITSGVNNYSVVVFLMPEKAIVPRKAILAARLFIPDSYWSARNLIHQRIVMWLSAERQGASMGPWLCLVADGSLLCPRTRWSIVRLTHNAFVLLS